MVLALLMSVGIASATEKWVDQSGGSDGNDGNTELTAYATLQFAINNSVSGTAGTPSIIHVKNGTYETTGQTNQGTSPTAIRIQNLDYLTTYSGARTGDQYSFLLTCTTIRIISTASSRNHHWHDSETARLLNRTIDVIVFPRSGALC